MHDDTYYFSLIRYNIKRIREDKELTHQSGITMNYLAKTESCKVQRGFSIIIMGRIADTLNVDIFEFFKKQ